MLHISLQYFKDNKNWKEFQEFSRLSLPQYVKLIFLNKQYVSKEDHFSVNFQSKPVKRLLSD